METTSDLTAIFSSLKTLLAPYAPPLTPKRDEPGYYDLWSIKDLVIEGRKRKEVFFAGLIIQMGYVGFYFMPVYAETELKAVFAPELLKLLTPELLVQIEPALRVGYALYQQRGWV